MLLRCVKILSDKKNILIKNIASDIQVYSYENESNNEYISRVIYSLISIHMRLSILDRSFCDNTKFKSKKYILNRAEEMLNKFLMIYPESQDWFYDYDSNESVVNIIRDRLEAIGELLPVGFNNDLMLPNGDKVAISDYNIIIRSIKNIKSYNITGLSFIEKSRNKFKCVDISKINEFYNYNIERLNNIYKKYIVGNMNEITEYDNFKVFDKYNKGSFFNSWSNNINLKENDITIYKYNDFDYGFIKKVNGKLFMMPISKYDSSGKRLEVYRYILNLKSESGNPNIAYLKRINKKYIYLRLTNRLPKVEESILLGIGWPKKNINDVRNIIFKIEVLDYVRSILNNLNIKVVDN